MAAKTVSTRLEFEKECKSCIRYKTKNKAKEEVLLTAYIMNEALEKLGNPDEITITITAEK